MLQELMEIKIKEIMNRENIPIANRNDPLSEVFPWRKETSHYWVVEGGGSKELVGVITEHDIIRVISPEKTSYPLGFPDIKVLCSTCPIEDIMTKNPITTRADKTMRAAITKIIKHRISVLPVLDKEENLVGEIRQGHITRKVSDIIVG